jgi:Gpi18-like mannosyltransferase
VRTRSLAPPLLVFAVSRLGIALLVLGVYAWLAPGDVTFGEDLGWPVDLWTQWDGVWYAQIADEGYRDPDSPAFFPLYPSLVAVLGRIVGGHYGLAGLMISLTACAVLFVLLYRLAQHHLGDRGALRTIVYLAIFPTSVFLGAVYSESLFLALGVGAFLLAERGRFGWAGVVAGLAMLCRLAGIALVPALLLMAWRAHERETALKRVLPGLAIFLVWPLYLLTEFGNPVEFVTATSSATTGWNRELSPFGPFGGLARGGYAAFLSGARLATGEELVDRPLMSGLDASFNVVQFLLVALFVALSFVAWRRFGAPYGVYAAIVLALPLANPVNGMVPLFSVPRYLLACFPAFMALAWLGRRRWLDIPVVVVSALLLDIALLRFGLSAWIS